MTHFVTVLFRWPDGIVLGNLIASALWATPTLVHLHRKLDRQHTAHMDALKGRRDEAPDRSTSARRPGAP